MHIQQLHCEVQQVQYDFTVLSLLEVNDDTPVIIHVITFTIILKVTRICTIIIGEF